MAVEDDNEIIVTTPEGLRRFHADGTLDMSFQTSPGGFLRLALQSDGKVVAATEASQGRFLVARYLSD
jgi:hypothetical protein